MITPPGGMLDNQRRARVIRLVGMADWYLVTPGLFDMVGSGDVSDADLRAVYRELGEGGVFVCVGKPKPVEVVLGRRGDWGTKRITQSTRRSAPIRPKLRWVAQGARVAVLPELGPVWVDGERLFDVGERVPLPWTVPDVAMFVVRPATVLQAMRKVVGSGGPKRAGLPFGEASRA
jgi:hypothetical protein